MFQNKKIIGVTGGIGSGKSTACTIFGEHGAYIIDADEVGHRALTRGQAAYNEVVDFFGDDILDEQSEINRKKLAEIVFTHAKKLEKLSRITHKYIKEDIAKEIEMCENSVVVLEAIALFESGAADMCDIVVAVSALRDIRIKRIMERDGLPEEKVILRMDSQKDDEYFEQNADFVLRTDKSIAELHEDAKKLWGLIS